MSSLRQLETGIAARYKGDAWPHERPSAPALPPTSVMCLLRVVCSVEPPIRKPFRFQKTVLDWELWVQVLTSFQSLI